MTINKQDGLNSIGFAIFVFLTFNMCGKCRTIRPELPTEVLYSFLV